MIRVMENIDLAQCGMIYIDVDNLTNAVLKRIFHKIYISYYKDDKGKKHPSVRYVYKFIDITGDELVQSIAKTDKNAKVNLHVFKPLYEYKNEQAINKELVKNGLEPIDFEHGSKPKRSNKTVEKTKKKSSKKLF